MCSPSVCAKTKVQSFKQGPYSFLCGYLGLMYKELDQSIFNPHQARCLKEICLTSDSTTSLKLDKKTGCLWFIVSASDASNLNVQLRCLDLSTKSR